MQDHIRQAYERLSQGDFDGAQTACRRALKEHPDNPDALLVMGRIRIARGDFPGAIKELRRLLKLIPEDAVVLDDLALAQAQSGDMASAERSLARARAVGGDHPVRCMRHGAALAAVGKMGEAESALRIAIADAPPVPDPYVALANVLALGNDAAAAIPFLQKALGMAPQHFQARFNLATLYKNLGRYAEAAGEYEVLRRMAPNDPDTLNNLGLVRQAEGNTAHAAQLYRAAVDAAPNHPQGLNNLGSLLLETGSIEEAESVLLRAHKSGGSADADLNLGNLYTRRGDYALARKHYEAALAASQGAADTHGVVLSKLIHARQNACDWDGIEVLWEKARAHVDDDARQIMSPFPTLSMPLSPTQQLRAARAWSQLSYSAYQRPAPELRGGRDGRRLRVGYLSSDFRQHAVTYLMAELFELHDRNRFDVFLYDLGVDDGSPVRTRLKAAVSDLVELRSLSIGQAADRIRADQIDILIDINGYTGGARTEIMACRPAPIQVNWLGYPGTMGASFIDYILADPSVIPPGAEASYSEKVWRLPDCYQPNDRLREIGETPTRESCGLPPEAFVFCCFNQSYKILPEVFDSWMRILNGVPGSVLWLVAANGWVSDNLKRAAAARGVAPERLIFAKRVTMPEYMAHYRLADLALDTFPYTSHTTGSDALRMGCPFVTHAGDTFASRVAASLLTNVGLGELVTASLTASESLTLALARDRERLGRIREKLRNEVLSSPLFDTGRFVRNLELAYDGMYQEAAGRG